MSFAEMRSALLGLTQDELAELRDLIDKLLPQVASSADDWLLPSLLQELKDRGLSYTIPSYFKIKGNKQYRGYGIKSKKIRGKLENAIPNMNLVQKYALAGVSAKLLADYIIEGYGGLSLDTLLNHIDLLPHAIESSFPGYLQSGFLHLLLSPAAPKTSTSLAETGLGLDVPE